MPKSPICIETLRRLIEYDPTTGILTWLQRPEDLCKSPRECRRWNSRFSGKPALTATDTKGYMRGTIMGRGYPAHHVAWALTYGEWPAHQVDHIDRDKTNNRLRNFRSATNAQNCRNRGARKDSKTGVAGVSFHKGTQKWCARIMVDGKRKHIGVFASIDDAIAARNSAQIACPFFAPTVRA